MWFSTNRQGERRVSLTWGERIGSRASEDPDRPALVVADPSGSEQVVSRTELEAGSNRIARLLGGMGVGAGSTVVIGLPNCTEHVVTAIAAWKLGAMVVPLNPALPEREREALLDLADPFVVVADWDGHSRKAVAREAVAAASVSDLSARPLPRVVTQPGKAIASGGSTGRPKLIVSPAPLLHVEGALAAALRDQIGYRDGHVQLVAGPLYHNLAFNWLHTGLLDGHTIVLLTRFDARCLVDLVERHHVSFMALVPTHIRRILAVPDVGSRDLSSLEATLHTGAPCAPWLKRAWIDLLGPTRVFEAFGATEGNGICFSRGDDWLRRPGTVGHPFATDVLILGADGEPVPPGEVGDIFMRSQAARDTFSYLGSTTASRRADGFVSVGDLGWVDQEGWLYLADRRVDLIITGGSNVYPAEVEGALSEHPAVEEVAVLGLPDDEWGKVVHAVIQAADPASPPTPEALDTWVRQRLSAYKAPRGYEFVSEFPRDAAGKVRRWEMVLSRSREGA